MFFAGGDVEQSVTVGEVVVGEAKSFVAEEQGDFPVAAVATDKLGTVDES